MSEKYLLHVCSELLSLSENPDLETGTLSSPLLRPLYYCAGQCISTLSVQSVQKRERESPTSRGHSISCLEGPLASSKRCSVTETCPINNEHAVPSLKLGSGKCTTLGCESSPRFREIPATTCIAVEFKQQREISQSQLLLLFSLCIRSGVGGGGEVDSRNPGSIVSSLKAIW